jgi:glycerol-3-phosphate dehydrogenase (NAD(P)+)
MTASDKKTIAVYGAGSWGTALALLLCRNGFDVTLWSYDAAEVERLARDRENKVYLPGFSFPPNLSITNDTAAVTRAHSRLLVAVPSHAFRATLKALSPHRVGTPILAWATKGFEPKTSLLLSAVCEAELGKDQAYGVASGPTFAIEVAKGLPSALTVAAAESTVALAIAEWLHNDHVRVYTSSDVTGVQLGGAIKNVIAIAAGISDGLGFGSNARAALVTRGIAELTRLGVALGGKAETFMGLTGTGDLILTATDNVSRNRRVGLALGQGKTLAQALKEIGQEAEGVATARELYSLARKFSVDMPITEQVYRVLVENAAPKTAVEALFNREPRREF